MNVPPKLFRIIDGRTGKEADLFALQDELSDLEFDFFSIDECGEVHLHGNDRWWIDTRFRSEMLPGPLVKLAEPSRIERD